MSETGQYEDHDFEWDEAKNQANIAKHGVSFLVARLAFNDPHIVSFSAYYVLGERRFDALGKVTDLSCVRVTYTLREYGNSERVRIISVRKADRKERGIYDEKVYG